MRILHRLSKYLLIVITVVTAATNALAASPVPVVIDWSKGDLQDTSASCGDFTFTHMKDRHGYSLYVRGKNSGTCSFQAKGLTFHYPPNHGATQKDTTTVYSFGRFGSDVVVAWSPGY